MRAEIVRRHPSIITSSLAFVMHLRMCTSLQGACPWLFKHSASRLVPTAEAWLALPIVRCCTQQGEKAVMSSFEGDKPIVLDPLQCPLHHRSLQAGAYL